MIPRIHQAELIKEDMWLVFFFDPEETRFPISRIVPTDENPVSCPGGILWCEQFGCVPGDNVFTRAKTELIFEEGDPNSGLTVDEILERSEEFSEVFENFGD